MKNYFEEPFYEWCTVCKQLSHRQQKCTIQAAPDLLVLALERFRRPPNKPPIRNSELIKFGEKLTVSSSAKKSLQPLI